jgi:hypothetical protein
MKRPSQLPLHTREQFDFIADAPLDVAWPLFGAQGERAWSANWHPLFVWPAEPADKQGMVFTVGEGGQTAVWVNTCCAGDGDNPRVEGDGAIDPCRSCL